jgi:hypothetical protein
MPRKLRLTALESDILRLLAEAGAEELEYLVNFVSAESAAHPSRPDVVPALAAAVANLVRLDIVYYAHPTPGYPPVQPDVASACADLATWLRWDPAGARWIASDSTSPPIVLALRDAERS